MIETQRTTVLAGKDRQSGGFDLAIAATLCTLIALSWMTCYQKWRWSSWELPTTYGNPAYADFIGSCAHIKGLGELGGLPFLWKTNSSLGAPDVANWNLQPTPEEVLSSIFVVLRGVLGLFAGFNVGVLLGHLSAAVTFYFVARRGLNGAPLMCFTAALAFGLAPYLFAESPHHINCLYAWHLPLCFLVWMWSAEERGIPWGTPRFWRSLAIGLLTGLQNPYYTFVFVQILLLTSAVRCARRTSWAELIAPAAVVAAAGVGFVLSNLDTVTYRLIFGAGDSPVVAQREYRWMDVYGFKIVDLFIPWITHHSEVFANFGLIHRQASILNDEEGCAYLGILGIACLFFLVASSARALIAGRLEDVPPEFWWVLWIVIFFNTGGLNSLVAAFTGFTLFRTGVRYSVVILVISLLHTARRVSGWQRAASPTLPPDLFRIASLTASAAACLIIFWDQVPTAPTAEQTAAIDRAVQSDRDFVERLESLLPHRSMVFQLPVSDGSPQNGLSASDHYRPYLYSTTLHWSHGATPGTETLQWQQATQQRLFEGAAVDPQSQQIRFNADNVRRAVDQLRKRGFAAIYVNRNSLPDRGKGLADALLELGYDKPPVYSAAGDLACILF